ncbi:hypothetical protein CBR_g22144 [Chara braunii]|uniref:Uncharacterized protein n=1 Tax=Chara braunii TaxID=69332 RepID=A0A388L266_CHABU|nr:hypothetical protein CBR_g22144 [Chara braunii]|eukprot:GBG76397.1 hypothetical protein CBR_g22144 [Chara braunii]
MGGLVLAGEFVERVRDLEKVANERAVIVGKATEGTKLKEGLGWGVLDEGCDFRGVHTDVFGGDNVVEVFDARSGKRTFVELGVKFLLSEDREDWAEDKDVIKADDDTNFEEVVEDVVHGRLEGSGGIGESEWHHEEILVPEPRAEGGLVGVLLADTDLAEATAKVDLGKVVGSTEMIKELGNPRRGRARAGDGGGGVDRGEACARVSKGHVGFVGEGGCKVFVAYSFDVGDERKVENDGGGEVLVEGEDVLDEASVGPVWRRWQNCSRGGGRVEEEGLVDMVVEVVGVEEVGGGVLLEAAVEEGVVYVVEVGGAAVVTTVMKGLFPSNVVTQSDMDDMEAFMSLREAVTEVWRVLSVWRMAERSVVVVFAGGCSPARLRVMLSTESVRMSDMLMEDAAMSGEEGVDDVAGRNVEDAAAASASASTRWEFLVWRGGMWREVKKKLIKQAKKLALLEEQAAKKKKLKEEMEKLKKEEEKKLKAVEKEEVEVEEEVPLERRTRTKKGESSGTKQGDQWMEKKISEWVANLSLGDEEEAMLYVTRAEQEAVVKELEEEEDPLHRQTIEEEKKLEWKLRLAREKKQRLDATDRVAKELRVVEEQRQQMENQADALGKMEIMATNIKLMAKAQ